MGSEAPHGTTIGPRTRQLGLPALSGCFGFDWEIRWLAGGRLPKAGRLGCRLSVHLGKPDSLIAGLGEQREVGGLTRLEL